LKPAFLKLTMRPLEVNGAASYREAANSSVGIVTGRLGVLFSAEAKVFTPQRPDQLCGQPSLLPKGKGHFLRG
jgi:hypothetical protein